MTGGISPSSRVWDDVKPDFPYVVTSWSHRLHNITSLNPLQLPSQVEEHNAVRLRLMAEMADSSNLVKTLVIKAEDARILSNMALTRKMYQQVRNRDNRLSKLAQRTPYMC
jgi:hypothetical protein